MDFDEKVVYLIFDDGFILEVMFWVLELLDKYNIKVIFFMVGDNICKYLDVFCMVVECGYCIGNYMFNYICGFEYLLLNYLVNMDKVNEMMKMDLFCLFYGYMCWM